MRYAILLAIAALSASLVSAQRPETAPFEAYPATPEKARAKRINFRSNPQARMFRTVLGEYLRDGVNFAGHYMLAEWGCEAGCSTGGVIDARNGNVYFPEQLAGMYLGCTYNVDDYPTTFRKNSRLLVISGAPASRRAKPCGKYYYEWKNNRFRLIIFIEKKDR